MVKAIGRAEDAATAMIRSEAERGQAFEAGHLSLSP
jgi:hypothetical protein